LRAAATPFLGLPVSAVGSAFSAIHITRARASSSPWPIVASAQEKARGCVARGLPGVRLRKEGGYVDSNRPRPISAAPGVRHATNATAGDPGPA
jgi:hypothetical protein